MHHYRIQYVEDDVPCEVTPTVASFKRQQGRWARGSLQVARKSLLRLLSMKDVKTKQKFEASIHLTYYLVHPLMYLSFLLAATAAILNIDSVKLVLPSAQQIVSIGTGEASPFMIVQPMWLVFGASIILCTLAAWIYYSIAMRMQHISVVRNASSLLALGFLG